MSDDEIVKSSASRKLTPFDRRKLQRVLAEGDKKRTVIAREFGISPSYVTQFARLYAHEIDEIKRDLNNAFAGLWIADKESRLVAYQTEYAMALGNEKASHHEWIKTRLQTLHQVAEELGQLPGRQPIMTVAVEHIIVGVNIEDLT